MKKPVIMWALLNWWGDVVEVTRTRQAAIQFATGFWRDLNWRQIKRRHGYRVAKVEVREIEG